MNYRDGVQARPPSSTPLAVAFSTRDAIQQHTAQEQTQLRVSESDVKDEFSLDQCAEWIERNKCSTVALQFPDELLHCCHAAVKQLKKCTKAELCVLADTSYGSCCADEIAAEHYQADAILHFGAACLSPSQRLPVLYVPGKQPIDAARCVEAITTLNMDTTTPVVLLVDLCYYHCSDEIHNGLIQCFQNVYTCRPVLRGNMEICTDQPTDKLMENTNDHAAIISAKESQDSAPTTDGNIELQSSSQISDESSEMCSKNLDTKTSFSSEHNQDTDNSVYECCGWQVSLPNGVQISDCTLIYVGRSDRKLTTLVMTWNIEKAVTYDPETRQAEIKETKTSRLVMKRYYLVEKVKDAGIVGLLVGTLGVKDYLKIIERLKTLLSKAGKKHYTFVVGKLNVAKLANFPEVNVFVLVSCPLNSLLDKGDYYQPIVTPHEVELALNPGMQWNGRIQTDFHALLEGSSNHVPLPVGDITENTDVSLITGNIRRVGVSADDPVTSSSAEVAIRNENTQLVEHQGAGEFLMGRSWKGLEQQLGETPVTIATEGQRGVAAGYSHEPRTS